ncbi:MAG: NADH-quinone oxidoreductase subunit B [Chloroflexi bacterium]|nr:NADH-quinone oxidoreductase subunit B [Chloroflexota bacterium]
MFEDDAVPVEKIDRNIFLTTVDWIYNWGRQYSMWPAMFGLACCAIEMIGASTARYDIARFGMEFYRASPRHADLMIVAGTVTHKMAPQVKRIWDQMPEPKYCLAMGSCAISGGIFKSYAVLQGVDEIVPVDVYVPGCPPRPEALFDGIRKIHQMVRAQSIKTVRWYGKEK